MPFDSACRKGKPWSVAAIYLSYCKCLFRKSACSGVPQLLFPSLKLFMTGCALDGVEVNAPDPYRFSVKRSAGAIVPLIIVVLPGVSVEVVCSPSDHGISIMHFITSNFDCSAPPATARCRRRPVPAGHGREHQPPALCISAGTQQRPAHTPPASFYCEW
jgi:hypothetical protein